MLTTGAFIVSQIISFIIVLLLFLASKKYINFIDYGAGSSVFLKGDSANPTLTIVQLALRLSDHLRKRVSEE